MKERLSLRLMAAQAEIDRLRAELADMAARAEAIVASENRLRAENAELKENLRNR